MAEKAKIGGYYFSEKCAACPYVALAVTRELAKYALFGNSSPKIPKSLESLRQDLTDSIFDEVDATDESLIGGSYADDCDGPSLSFTEGVGSYIAVCGRKIEPYKDEIEDENQDQT